MYAKLSKLYQENPQQGRIMLLMLVVFLAIYFLPAGNVRFDNAVLEGIRLTHWYAQEHVILCLLPAFIIAGAMAVYISQGSVLRYLGPQASKPIALSVASVSGTLLAVCSCTRSGQDPCKKFHLARNLTRISSYNRVNLFPVRLDVSIV